MCVSDNEIKLNQSEVVSPRCALAVALSHAFPISIAVAVVIALVVLCFDEVVIGRVPFVSHSDGLGGSNKREDEGDDGFHF